MYLLSRVGNHLLINSTFPRRHFVNKTTDSRLTDLATDTLKLNQPTYDLGARLENIKCDPIYDATTIEKIREYNLFCDVPDGAWRLAKNDNADEVIVCRKQGQDIEVI